MDAVNAFKLLELAPTRDAQEIRRAWRDLRSKVHPDHGGTVEDFNEGYAAYDTAITYALTPMPCAACDGEGSIAVHRNFVAAREQCATCGGTGQADEAASR